VTRVNAAGSLVRDDNAFRYVSPAFSGLTVSLYKSNKQTKAVDTTAFSTSLGAYDKLGSEEIGANYANGPIAASFSSLKQDSREVAGATTSSRVNTLGANYTMGAAKFFVLNQTNKNTGATTVASTVDTSFTSVSAAYTMGATTVMAQMGNLKADAGTFAGQKSKLVGIGADYALSKRSTIYARYESIDDKAGVATGANNGNFSAIGTETTRTRAALGVRHTF
jgi:predicted porin